MSSWSTFLGYGESASSISSLESGPIQSHRDQGLPRVWWIGTGLASSMPFHAAGVHAKGSAENCYSRVLSSYTPSIKALSLRTGSGEGYGRRVSWVWLALLITTMPTTPKGRGDKRHRTTCLVWSKRRGNSSRRLKASIRRSFLRTPMHRQVLDRLETCRVAHFACHGTSDHIDPSNSGLILQKGGHGPGCPALEPDRLTVHAVSELRLEGAHQPASAEEPGPNYTGIASEVKIVSRSSAISCSSLGAPFPG